MLMRASAFALLAAMTACNTSESIRVRERGEFFFSGRIRKTATLSESERHHVAIGGELGAYGTTGNYASPSGNRDYRATVGYAAFVADVGVGDFTILPKLGLGAVDFAVAGQSNTVGDDGLGVMLGVEGRYLITPMLDVFARATAFRRSSLYSTMLEAGVGFRPAPYVAIELGYGNAGVVVDDSFDIFNNSDSADVEVQGLLISLTLQF